MRNLILFFHLAATIFWMGGIAFMLLALRGPATAQLQPPVRLPLLRAVLGRFFVIVTIGIVVLLSTGAYLLLGSGVKPPAAWHAMAGLGVLMMLLFGHLYFGPYRRLKMAVDQADWAEGGKRMGQIALLAKFILGIGWLAIAAVRLWR